MRLTTRRTAAGAVLTLCLALTACGGEDAPEVSDVQQEVEDTGQQVEEGAEDAGNEVEEQVDEGAEESDEEDENS